MELFFKNYGIKDDQMHRCPGCGYNHLKVYTLADNKQEADTRFDEDKGICGNCMTEALFTEKHIIFPKKQLIKMFGLATHTIS